MKVLIAFDGSPESEYAVTEAGRRPWPPQSELRLLMVDPPVEARLLKGSPTAFDMLVQRQRAEAALRLHRAAERLRRAASKVRVVERLKEGWPKREILEEARRWGADLILIGSQCAGALKRFLLGSVSLAVVANAPCSIEVVRKPRS